jgi:cobalt-precorrin 5A hydrolase
MEGDEAMIVAGVGFRTGVTPDEIVDLVERAMSEAAVAQETLTRLATAAARADEAGFRTAAQRLGLPVAAVDCAAMARSADKVVTVSSRVMAAYGVGSVAEAAALACAGPDARLLVPRIASARATCAIARGSAT